MRDAGSPPSGLQPRDLRARSCGLLGLGGDLRVALLEPVDATLRVDEVLLAREERVAVRADLDMQLGLDRHRLERAAAGADDLRLDVLGVDLFLHRNAPSNSVGRR